MGRFKLVQLLLTVIKVVCLLVTIAYYTIAERKIMAAIQRRRGPNVVGFWGLLQPLADGLKLIAKEMVIPSHSNSKIFAVAPLGVLTLSLVSWAILPFGCFDSSEKTTSLRELTSNDLEMRPRDHQLPMHKAWEGELSREFFGRFSVVDGQVLHGVKLPLPADALTAGPDGMVWAKAPQLFEVAEIADISYGLLALLALSSLSVYGLILSGWASNSKYAFLGALRSAAQMISYEVSISLVLVPVIFLASSMNLTKVVVSQIDTVLYIFPLASLAIIFFISMIAETNRTPFDLPEAEAELVAGYNVEFSSIIFAMFFLAEYGNMAMMSILKADLFFGGWFGPAFLPGSFCLAVKALFFCFAFVLVRATFPRYRYDQLMDIGWKVFLLVATGLLLFVIGLVAQAGAVPVVLLFTVSYLEANKNK